MSCSIPVSLVFFRYATIRALRYKSNGGVNVRVSRDHVGVAQNAPAIIRRHLFWMIPSLGVIPPVSRLLSVVG
jgi:hypothetical protein